MFLLFATYLHTQLARNVGCNVVLYGSDIGGSSPVLLTPDLRAVTHIHHLSLDVKGVSVLTQAAYNCPSLEDRTTQQTLELSASPESLAEIISNTELAHLPKIS
jgi:hypothetical protein